MVMSDPAYHLRQTALGLELSLIHISEPTRRRGISYAVFCLKKKNSRVGRGRQ